LPAELATLLAQQKEPIDNESLRRLIYVLCGWKSLTVDQLASLLHKDRHYLRNKHLSEMVRDGQLALLYPESAKHPHQAYIALVNNNVEAGRG
jgi:ATP-dependent DNA helicase RecG